MKRVIAGLEKALEATRRIFVVYYNSIQAACFDARPAFTRYFAATLPYAVDELGFGPDDADPVVTWQAGLDPRPPHLRAEATIRVIREDNRCELVT